MYSSTKPEQTNDSNSVASTRQPLESDNEVFNKTNGCAWRHPDALAVMDRGHCNAHDICIDLAAWSEGTGPARCSARIRAARADSECVCKVIPIDGSDI